MKLQLSRSKLTLKSSTLETFHKREFDDLTLMQNALSYYNAMHFAPALLKSSRQPWVKNNTMEPIHMIETTVNLLKGDNVAATPTLVVVADAVTIAIPAATPWRFKQK